MYPIDEYSVSFSSSYGLLQIKNASNEVVGSFDLTQNNPPYSLKVSSGNYIIAQTDCSTCEERYAIDVDANAGSASVQSAKLGGLGIIDLRDTGRTNLTVEFDLECDAVQIRRIFNDDFGLRFSTVGTDCYAEIE